MSITPGNNFFYHVNSEWIKNIEIPDDHQSWGAFQILKQLTEERIKKLIENSQTHCTLIYYQSISMKDNIQPSDKYIIDSMLDSINKSITHTELFGVMIDYDIMYDFNIPVNFHVGSDYNNSDDVIVHLTSGGIGLPDRDYYFLDSKKEIRVKYLKFISDYSQLFNIDINPEVVFEIEKQLASKMHTRVQRRDPLLLNNMTTLNQFKKIYPNLSFIEKIIMVNRTISNLNDKDTMDYKINISNPNYFKFLNDVIKQIPLEHWKMFHIFKTITEFNNYLSNSTREQIFNFYSKVLYGVKIMKPKWEQSIEMIERTLGELVGKLYTDKYFSQKSKNVAINIFSYIKKELKEYLKNNNWMEKSTKIEALKKLRRMRIKIGFPDSYEKDYTKLFIDSNNTLLQNILIIKKFNNNYKLARLYRPANRDLWFMNSHMVNAYYSPSYNEIVFPAGILQEPFFSINMNMASNFGGFGMIIGHEITHGFDDAGCKFDSNGNLKNWWTPNDFKKYNMMADIIKSQYEKYKIEGEYINPELTLGENMADIGGLGLSYNAYMRYLEEHPNENTKDNKREFFYNYARIWRSKARREDILQRLLVDTHSPPIYRVNGGVANINAFYELFDVTPEDEMYIEPTKRAKIWTL
jgi:putative endopeptidase